MKRLQRPLDKLAMAAAVSLFAMGLAAPVTAGGHNVRPSISVETQCFPNGDVTVIVTDETNDDGAADVGNVAVDCLASVKAGRGRPDQVSFHDHSIDDPISPIEVTCDLGQLPAGATEWRATATASGGNLRKSVSDTCDEQILADPD
jgi:hypothetical protein